MTGKEKIIHQEKMAAKRLTKIIQQLLLMCKKVNIHQSTTHIMNNKIFKDSERRRMILSCSKKLSALLRGIMSRHDDDFYCLNCFHSFRTKCKLEPHKTVCQI